MNDALLLAMWIGLVLSAIAFCVGARRKGVATTHLRDLVHVGAGLWPLGWPMWQAKAAPLALALAGATATFLVPRAKALAGFQQSISDADERWSGVQLYGVAFALATGLGLSRWPFESAAALLALSLGDGIGGAIGKRFGRHFFSAPGGKRKSFEGSLAVATLAAVGVALAAAVFAVPLALGTLLAAAAIAALAEALAPAGTDNLVIPAAVFAFLGVAS